MTELTFKDIRERNLLLYEYIRGSHAYGMATSESDVDHGGIYIAPNEQLLGLGFDYQDEVADNKHDDCWWEIGKFMRLTLKCSPIVLEALFIPEDKILYEHPLITELKKHRNMFLTKKCFKAFTSYAISQIEKAQGQNKKIMWNEESMVRKTPLDFIYTPKGQGSQNIQDWLDERGLEQRNIGLVNIPNMPNSYGVYYDYGQHITLNGITKEYFCDFANREDKFIKFCFNNLDFGYGSIYPDESPEQYATIMEHIWENNHIPKGKHCGIISSNVESNELRCNSHVVFSSIEKGDEPICNIQYNQNAYEMHCRKYKEYKEWENTRNIARYENNLDALEKDNVDKFYDSKNMSHCFRLIAIGTEVAQGKGMNVCRSGIDADFLLDIRHRKYTYNELMDILAEKKAEMQKAMEESDIPETIDVDIVNEMLLNIRNKFNN